MEKDKTKFKKVIFVGALILCGIFSIIIYTFATSNIFGRKISRMTGGMIAATYEVPEDATELVSISVTKDTDGHSVKDFAFLLNDCSYEIREYRDGLNGILFHSKIRFSKGFGKEFQSQSCLKR